MNLHFLINEYNNFIQINKIFLIIYFMNIIKIVIYLNH